jgi:hypothetical protein
MIFRSTAISALRLTLLFLTLINVLWFIVSILTGMLLEWRYEQDLRAIFVPPADCQTLCFLGLEVGVTTTQEALDVLNANAYVVYDRTQPRWHTQQQLITQVDMQGQIGAAGWCWNPRDFAVLPLDFASKCFYEDRLSRIEGGAVIFQNGAVYSITAITYISYRDIKRVLGEPLFIQYDFNHEGGNMGHWMRIYYPHLVLLLSQEELDCPLTFENMENATVFVRIDPSDLELLRNTSIEAHPRLVEGSDFNGLAEGYQQSYCDMF